MGQSSHNEVVLFHWRDLPTQPPLPARLGKRALIIHYEALTGGAGRVEVEEEVEEAAALIKLIFSSVCILMKPAGHRWETLTKLLQGLTAGGNSAPTPRSDLPMKRSIRRRWSEEVFKHLHTRCNHQWDDETGGVLQGHGLHKSVQNMMTRVVRPDPAPLSTDPTNFYYNRLRIPLLSLTKMQYFCLYSSIFTVFLWYFPLIKGRQYSISVCCWTGGRAWLTWYWQNRCLKPQYFGNIRIKTPPFVSTNYKFFFF